MREIVEVIPIEDYHLKITFDDDVTEVVDMKPLMKRQAFQPLWDEDFFARVEVDRKFKGILWPRELDVCIDWIEAEIERRRSRVKFA
jgi:hypothetical protein